MGRGRVDAWCHLLWFASNSGRSTRKLSQAVSTLQAGDRSALNTQYRAHTISSCSSSLIGMPIDLPVGKVQVWGYRCGREHDGLPQGLATRGVRLVR